MELYNPKLSMKHMRQLSFRSQTIEGTDGYWRRARSEVEAIMDAKGCPTIFYTLSAADTQWERLSLLMGHKPGAKADPTQHHQILLLHPHMAASFFHMKLEEFNKHLDFAFGVDWDWHRFEFQSRGSIHVHGFKKLNNDPGLTRLAALAVKGRIAVDRLSRADADKTVTPEEREKLEEAQQLGNDASEIIRRYADWLLSTCSPHAYTDSGREDGSQPLKFEVPDYHPANKLYGNVNTNRDYAELLHKVERHSQCRKGSCKRPVKGGKYSTCRFKFPKDLEKVTRLVFKKTQRGSYKVELATKRNDARVNSHNRTMLQHWRGNIDVQIVLDARVCARYLAKYSTKGEVKSKAYLDACSKVGDSIGQWDGAGTPHRGIHKLMQELNGQRDISIQECAQTMLGHKLAISDFGITHIDLRKTRILNKEKLQECKGNAKLPTKRNIVDHYAKRLEDEKALNHWPTLLPSINLAKFAVKFKYQNGVGIVPNTTRKEHVINYYPKGPRKPASPEFWKACKANLQVFKPWTGTPDSLWDDDPEANAVAEWKKFIYSEEAEQLMSDFALESFRDQLEPEDRCLEEQVTSLAELDPLDFAARAEGIRKTNDNRPAWAIIIDPHGAIPEPPKEVDELIDLARHNFNKECGEYDPAPTRKKFRPLMGDAKKWLKGKREFLTVKDYPLTKKLVDLNQASPEQKRVVQLVHNAIRTGKLLRLGVYGKAGTGKSWIINAVEQILVEHGQEYVLAASTGIAAVQIGGITLHKAVNIPTREVLKKPLSGNSLRRLQNTLDGKKWLIIDEIGMVGGSTWGWLSRRLMEVQTCGNWNAEDPLGGMNVIILGDIMQLPPVKDNLVFNWPYKETSDKRKLDTKRDGNNAYVAIDKVITLRKNHRQRPNPNDSHETRARKKKFLGVLDKFYMGEMSEDDYHWIMQRDYDFLSPEEKKRFDMNVHLFARNEDKDLYNLRRLHELNIKNKKPVVRLRAVCSDNSKTTMNGSLNEYEGVPGELCLCVGAPVMLRKNLLAVCGLANSSMGNVYDFLYTEHQTPNEDLPEAVLVDFPGYRGPRWCEDPSVPATVVPVAVATGLNETNGRSRKNVPLDLAFGMTVYKSQGLTLPAVTLRLGRPEGNQVGRTYVAMSRVKDLNDLCIIRENGKGEYRYFRDIKMTGKSVKKLWRERQKELVNLEKLSRETAYELNVKPQFQKGPSGVAREGLDASDMPLVATMESNAPKPKVNNSDGTVNNPDRWFKDSDKKGNKKSNQKGKG